MTYIGFWNLKVKKKMFHENEFLQKVCSALKVDYFYWLIFKIIKFEFNLWKDFWNNLYSSIFFFF